MAAPSGRDRVASALLLLLLLVLGAAETTEANAAVDPNQERQVPWSAAPAPSPMNINCRSACASRCALSSRPNLCNRACGSCCARCNCVPPGTSGNYHMCPCYAAITTRGGRPKCP
ncbi:gibberellin-regulated protein 11-like [Panicum virgatum]|uniref:Snakin-2 n=1 Tax=Panicum virgatum TaxID=38727 RepID=A0A8T0Q475_PANVG|nr:gibberellin-regulated protein 11-like [Panicum virgatum]KAG2569727.1 hypothetical protein PVAP13_7NG437100 [Panicum virgatum]